MKVPDVERCCFCFPLRRGIVVLGILNTMMSLLGVVSLVMASNQVIPVTKTGHYLDIISTTVMLSILGMGVILNILLFIAGYQKDSSLLRLYNSYAIVIIFVAIIHMAIQLWKQEYREVSVILFVIAMQVYIILLVRSEVVKLEGREIRNDYSSDVTVDIGDRESLV